MPAPTPADWEEFYRIAAAKEAADGNGKACRTLLRYARIERVRAHLSSRLNQSNHSGVNSPISGA